MYLRGKIEQNFGAQGKLFLLYFSEKMVYYTLVNEMDSSITGGIENGKSRSRSKLGRRRKR